MMRTSAEAGTATRAVRAIAMMKRRTATRSPLSSVYIARDEREVRLEKARKELLATLETLRGEMLTQKEADAVEAAIEDELIALRVGPF